MSTQIGKASYEILRPLVYRGTNVGKATYEVLRATRANGANIGKVTFEVLRSLEAQPAVGAVMYVRTDTEWIPITGPSV